MSRPTTARLARLAAHTAAPCHQVRPRRVVTSSSSSSSSSSSNSSRREWRVKDQQMAAERE